MPRSLTTVRLRARFLAAAACLALIAPATRAGSAPVASAPTHHGAVKSAGSHRADHPAYTTGPVIFGSDQGASTVDVYKQSSGFPLVKQITDSLPNFCGVPKLDEPEGLWVDKARDLWVADDDNHDIREFALGSNVSSMSLSDTDYYPTDVAKDDYGPASTNGNVYASNAYGPNFSPPGNVVGWTPAAQVCNGPPNIVLTDPSFYDVRSISTDKAGDLYVSYENTSFSDAVCVIAQITIAAPGAVNVCAAPGFISNVVESGKPGGIRVQGSKNVIGIVNVGASRVDLYTLPLGVAGVAVPCEEVMPPANSYGGPLVAPYALAFYNLSGIRLWTADLGTLAYPTGELLRSKDVNCPTTNTGGFTGAVWYTNSLKTIDFKQLVGVAVSPALSP